MHGGVIYIRGEVQPYQLGREVGILEPDASDMETIMECVVRFTEHFGGSVEDIMSQPFIKLSPVSSRPYGKLYTY
jgi:glutamate synthase domain-containing protein 3